MSEFNAFLDEWKSIRTTQETILSRLGEQEAKNKGELLKIKRWASGGYLMAFMVVGILIGMIINTNAQIKSVPYAVSSETGCKAMGGQLADSGNQKLCVFPMK